MPGMSCVPFPPLDASTAKTIKPMTMITAKVRYTTLMLIYDILS